MRNAAAQLETLRRNVDFLISQLIWEGVDADAFNEQWLSSLSASIMSAESMLDSVANVLMANAQQQLEASNAPSGFYNALDYVGKFVAGTGAVLHLVGASPAGEIANDVLGKIHWSPAVNEALSKSPWMKSLDGVLGHDPETAFGQVDGLLHGEVSTEALGTAAAAVGVALNGWSFVHDLSTDPRGSDTYNKGVETALGIAALAIGATTPVGIGIAVGELGYDVATHFDPNLGKQIVGGVMDAGKALVHVDEEEIKVTEAAARVMSSGVRGALSLIHVHL